MKVYFCTCSKINLSMANRMRRLKLNWHVVFERLAAEMEHLLHWTRYVDSRIFCYYTELFNSSICNDTIARLTIF